MDEQHDLQNPFERHQALQLHAYHLWEQRGQPWGTPETDWFMAEHELDAERQDAAPEPAAVSAAKAVGSILGSVAGALASLAHAAGSE